MADIASGSLEGVADWRRWHEEGASGAPVIKLKTAQGVRNRRAPERSDL